MTLNIAITQVATSLQLDRFLVNSHLTWNIL